MKELTGYWSKGRKTTYPDGGVLKMEMRSKVSEVVGAERIFAEFFNRSNVGLAVFDEALCYRMLNYYLAASNGTSIESHLGKHVREILGEVGLQVEPAIKQVFATAQPVLNCEVAGVLPTKPGGGHWVDTFFPIAGTDGSVKQVGVVVVELAEDIHIEQANEHLRSPVPVLRSWKDIAQYVRTSVKTVQRWEHSHDFPVRRVNPTKGSVVFALQEEIDEWLRSRNLHLQASFAPNVLRNERGTRR